MYANINEAWKTTSIFPEYNNDYTSDSRTEKLHISNTSQSKMMGTTISQPEKDNEEIYEHFNRDSCDYYLNHVMNCSKCYNYITRNQNNNFLTNDVKEIIIIVLIGIILIFIIDLFVKGLKKN